MFLSGFKKNFVSLDFTKKGRFLQRPRGLVRGGRKFALFLLNLDCLDLTKKERFLQRPRGLERGGREK